MNEVYRVTCFGCGRRDYFPFEPELGTDYEKCECGRSSWVVCVVGMPEGCLVIWDERPLSHALMNMSFECNGTVYEIDMHVKPVGEMEGRLLLADEVPE